MEPEPDTDELIQQLIADTLEHVAAGLLTEEEGKRKIEELKARLEPE